MLEVCAGMARERSRDFEAKDATDRSLCGLLRGRASDEKTTARIRLVANANAPATWVVLLQRAGWPISMDPMVHSVSISQSIILRCGRAPWKAMASHLER